VVKDEFLTPLLLNIGTMNTMMTGERSIGESTVSLKGRIEVKGQSPIVMERKFTGMQATALSSLAIALPVNVLLQSRFPELEITNIDFEMQAQDGGSSASLERITASRNEAKAGDTIEVVAFVRGEGGAVYQQKIPVKIPSNTPAGSLTITVADGGEIQQTSITQQFTPKTLEELVSTINAAKKSDQLYVQLTRTSNGAVIGASEMPNLPPSVLATLSNDRTTGGVKTTTQSVMFEQELAPAEFVISGKQSLIVQIVR